MTSWIATSALFFLAASVVISNATQCEDCKSYCSCLANKGIKLPMFSQQSRSDWLKCWKKGEGGHCYQFFKCVDQESCNCGGNRQRKRSISATKNRIKRSVPTAVTNCVEQMDEVDYPDFEKVEQCSGQACGSEYPEDDYCAKKHGLTYEMVEECYSVM